MEAKTEIEAFRQHLKKSGLRYTPEREQIIREIFTTHDHFDVDTIYFRMRQSGTSVSKASVYRLIPLLIEGGLINEVFFEDGHMHYEHIFGHEHHSHIRCTECRRIEEFKDSRLDKISDELSKKYGYRVSGHKFEVYGLCPQCRGDL